jgi:hypothetical protein
MLMQLEDPTNFEPGEVIGGGTTGARAVQQMFMAAAFHPIEQFEMTNVVVFCQLKLTTSFNFTQVVTFEMDSPGCRMDHCSILTPYAFRPVWFHNSRGNFEAAMRNNIMSGFEQDAGTAVANPHSHNCFEEAPVGLVLGEGEFIAADPGYVSRGSATTEPNLELAVGSSCRQAGVPGVCEVDIYERPRGNKPDLGAYQTTAAV